MSKKTNRKAIAKLDALYARIPRMACRGLCAEACGPLPIVTLEAQQMAKAGKRLPMTTDTLTCIYLSAHARCSIYDARPLICRAWGALKSLSCMHGCEPERWLAEYEFVEIAKALEQLGGPVLHTGPGGVENRGYTFKDLNTVTRSRSEVDAYAERTRTARALHGGRVLGIVPSAEGKWTDMGKEENDK